MAAMTLLLAHLDSHWYLQTGNILAHQYLSDRAMIEQTQESMEKSSPQDRDPLTAKSAALLRRFLAILGEAADGNPHCVESVSVSVKAPETEMELSDENNNNKLRFFVPCGIISIAREGVIYKENPKPQYSVADNIPNESAIYSEIVDKETITSAGTSLGYTQVISSMLPPRSAAHGATQPHIGHLSAPPTGFNLAATQLTP